MGHDIRAFADKTLKVEIAALRLFPSEAFAKGNVYAVLEATNCRNSCSGSFKTITCQFTDTHTFPVQPNIDSKKFLDDVYHNHNQLVDGLVYISFR